MEALERSRLPAEELKEVEKILLRWVTFYEKTAAIFENDEKTQVAPLLRDFLPELVENTPNRDNYCQSAGVVELRVLLFLGGFGAVLWNCFL